MACKKVLLVFLLLSATSVLAHNLTQGARESGDFLLQRNYIMVPWKPLQTVELTESFSSNSFYRITQVRFIDQNTEGKGADVEIVAGGANYNSVTGKFVSKRGNNIEFRVEVYGK